MKFHMNLFCLIIALATSIVDGRISSSSMSSSSSSSSSSLSQPIGGSAEDVNPNRRVLEPAGVDSETQYCKATPVGKQRGVVDWQDHDQCKMCEVGQKYWPCDGDILCEGYCTPEDVCDKRIQVAIDIVSSRVEKDAITAEKDGEIADLEKENVSLRKTVAVLKANLANTDAPITAPSTSAATDFDFASFYNNIKNQPIEDEQTECSSGSGGGDCSQNPTYCSSVGSLEGRKATLSREIEMIEADIKVIGSNGYNNIVDCRCEASRRSRDDRTSWECSGGCSAPNSCLNLDFVCSPSAPTCELSCTGRNSCNGVTMYCADNQACALTTCGDGTERCVDAKVVYNGEVPSRFGFSSASDRTWNNNNSFSKNDIDF